MILPPVCPGPARSLPVSPDFVKSPLAAGRATLPDVRAPVQRFHRWAGTLDPVVGRLVHEAKERLHRLSGLHPKAMARLREQFNWSTHEVIILASIVEKEAAAADEQRLVASVFFNRLLDREFRPARRLQSDPTAAYGCMVAPGRAPSCKASARGVTASMLRDAANPYNTYAHPGLPPGPIGNPGESAILAVLDPAQTDFLFFVARGAGRHHFSRTLEQHNQAIRQIGR